MYACYELKVGSQQGPTFGSRGLRLESATRGREGAYSNSVGSTSGDYQTGSVWATSPGR